MKLSMIVKAFLALLFTLVVLELFLRWSGISMRALIKDDDTLGRVLRPNTDILLVNEGFCIGRVNKGGYLGPYYPEEKPDHSIRIAIIGDSYVAGFQLFDRHHFRSIMEHRLNEMCSDSIQVLNFGFAGFNLERMYIYYKLKIRSYHPDYVIFFVGMDDLYEHDRKAGPQCVLKDGKLTIDYGFRDTKAYKTTKQFAYLRNTAFYSLNKKALEMYTAGLTPEIVFDKVYKFFKKPVAARDSIVTLTPGQTSMSEAIIADLAGIKDTCIIFAVKNYLSDEIQNYIRSQHLPVFDLNIALDSLRARGIDPNYWSATSRFGHWNYQAHEVIGIYLASMIGDILKAKN